MMGKWIYGSVPSFPYGDETSYKKAVEFLDGPYIIEDWGCGTAYAQKFVKRGRYVGVDGSWSLHRHISADLRTYRSSADAILMRHILEHNDEWQKVLENALASFQKKMCLIIFTPFSDKTHQIVMNPNGVPDISFCKDDLMKYLAPFNPKEEVFQSATQYSTEHIFYLEKNNEPR